MSLLIASARIASARTRGRRGAWGRASVILSEAKEAMLDMAPFTPFRVTIVTDVLMANLGIRNV
jgi:hypothetical protein